ncbi:hypothetical protein DZ11F47_39140 [Escherichia coli]|nr:hypothetical protein VEE29_47790 [Escherichia coli]
MLAYCVANINHIIATDGWLLSTWQINGLMSLSCIYSGWVVSVRPNTRTQLPQTALLQIVGGDKLIIPFC